MMIYNYIRNMKEDILDFIAENVIEFNSYEDLYDDLFNEDYITGNASGSYTCSRREAMHYLLGNFDLISEACDAFGVSMDEIGRRFLNEEWEWIDVIVRCYLLPTVLCELENDR